MRISKLGFYIGIILIVVGESLLQRHVALTYLESPIEALSPLQLKQLDALLAMNQLITTLSTGLLGAMGFLLVNVGKARLRSGTPWTAVGGALCVGFSLYYGYVV